MASKKMNPPVDAVRVRRVLALLKKTYPQAHCSLRHENPFQLLVATVLSAQCTDARVNQVTPALFARFPTPAAMSVAKLSDLESLIRSTGFYKNKAKSLQALSADLVSRHSGAVPQSIEELTRLRGVGRKTANVILGNAFGIPGLVVDTHVGRLSRRLGFTRHEDPVKVEYELMEIIPKKDWTLYSHWLIDHGRAVCDARNPGCEHCVLAELCPKIGVLPQIRRSVVKGAHVTSRTEENDRGTGAGHARRSR